jgi:hypothetical protein
METQVKHDPYCGLKDKLTLGPTGGIIDDGGEAIGELIRQRVERAKDRNNLMTLEELFSRWDRDFGY